jgi:hypothetical protein
MKPFLVHGDSLPAAQAAAELKVSLNWQNSLQHDRVPRSSTAGR